MLKEFLFKKEWVLKKRLIYVVPFVLYVISFSPFYFQSWKEKSALLESSLSPWIFSLFDLKDVYLILSGLLYAVLSFRVLVVFENYHDNKLSNSAATILKWIRIFLILNLFLIAIWVAGEIFEIRMSFVVFKIYFLGLTILAFGTEVLAIFYLKFFNSTHVIKSEKDLVVIDRPVLPTEIPMPSIKNVSSRRQLYLKNVENERGVKRIIEFIEETKPFLNKDITLQILAADIGFTKHRVSELLNNNIGSSFYDLINEYRIKEVIRLINEGKHKEHTILYLAKSSGFNSKSTFNRTFKKVTGETPSEYINILMLHNLNIDFS